MKPVKCFVAWLDDGNDLGRYASLCNSQAQFAILIQSELSPQINPSDFFVGGQAGGSAALEDDAAVDDVGAVSNAQGFAHVVVGDQHADPAVAEVKDDLLDVRHRDRIDAGKRLVEQDEFRRDHQRARD